LIVSLRQGEDLTREQWRDVERTMLGSIDFERHPRLSAVHQNTEHEHIAHLGVSARAAASRAPPLPRALPATAQVHRWLCLDAAILMAAMVDPDIEAGPLIGAVGVRFSLLAPFVHVPRRGRDTGDGFVHFQAVALAGVRAPRCRKREGFLTWLQRAWAVISLLVLAVFLAWYFLEWAGYSASDDNAARVVLEFYHTTSPTDCPVDTSSPIYKNLCAGGKSNILMVMACMFALVGRFRRRFTLVRSCH
jgi:hypothetical protein